MLVKNSSWFFKGFSRIGHDFSRFYHIFNDIVISFTVCMAVIVFHICFFFNEDVFESCVICHSPLSFFFSSPRYSKKLRVSSPKTARLEVFKSTLRMAIIRPVIAFISHTDLCTVTDGLPCGCCSSCTQSSSNLIN